MGTRTSSQRFGARLLVIVALATFAPLFASDIPAPPRTPLDGLVRRLTSHRAVQGAAKPAKADLFRPEFRFQPTRDWILLPELARQLTTNETERKAILDLLDQGAREARRLLAAEAEGADRDVAAATTLFISRLWSLTRQVEASEEATDALHAQIVGALSGPEVATISNADKQRYWEFCLGFQVFLMGMKEIATEPAAHEDLRKVAAVGFESVVGVSPHLVDLGPQGLVERAGLDEAARRLQNEPNVSQTSSGTVVRAPSPPPAPASGPALSALTYSAPAGWQRDEAGGAVIFRATLRDVDDAGRPQADSSAQHAASIFVLPPRPTRGGAQATFEAAWNELFEAYEHGDTLVHYRSHLRSGLVIHFMGRILARKNAPSNVPGHYAVLYLVDLGGGRVQPIFAIAVPDNSAFGMNVFKESAAHRAIAWPLAALLESLQPIGGKGTYAGRGYFSPDELHGDWVQSTSAFGGFYVNSATGASAGAAIHSAGGTFRLSADGTYEYSLAFSTYSPQSGRTSGSERHSGRFRLNGDAVLVEPTTTLRTPFTYCAVGVGTRRVAGGTKRMLVMVSAAKEGDFRAPPAVPNWDAYEGGVMHWYQEK